jgi:integrase
LGWIERNPCERVTKPKEAGGRVRFLSDDELPRLLAAVRASSHTDLLPAVLLALTTGARKGEILGLRWSQIDFKRRAITLHQGETKNNAGRALPLSGEIVELLKARNKVRQIDDDRVFPPPGIARNWNCANRGRPRLCRQVSTCARQRAADAANERRAARDDFGFPLARPAPYRRQLLDDGRGIGNRGCPRARP